ncbi:amidohydrolase family protein [Enterococcus casseliflavus]|uniref:amidohydrolase family protein n=1 Tax=Enterococcus TaxID=1350 RepID=UPI0023D7F790|nr:amidohydrolase family protein [Enterococcus casseliflavus]WEI93000.1 amidohydrolase family protein [Enterococcus casseliflavus]
MDLWLTNVQLETSYLKEGDWSYGTKTENTAIGINDGKIAEIVPMTEWQASSEATIIDGGNQLLLPGLIEKHCHLDKSKLGTPWRPVTPAASLVERFETEIPQLDALPLSIKERGQALIDLELPHGAVMFRSHIDIEPMTQLRYFDAITELVAEQPFGSELVLFSQHGLLRSNAASLIEEALATGKASFIGGVDPYTLDQDYQASLRTTFELAQKGHVGIDLHLHDRQEAGRATVKEMIRLTKEFNMQGNVAISHAFGLNDFEGTERKEVFQSLADLEIHIISSIPISPGTIPPLKELQSYGVAVHIGCDNVYDSWSSLGDGSLQEKLARYLEIFAVKSQEDLTQALGLVTDGKVPLDKNGAQQWPKVGDSADFLLTPATCTAEFVARKGFVSKSFYQGTVVFTA